MLYKFYIYHNVVEKLPVQNFFLILETALKVWKDNKYLNINSKLENHVSVVFGKS